MLPPASEARRSLHERIEAGPLPANLWALFDQAVARFGAKPFWVSMDGQCPDLTFGEVGALVDRCAAGLAALGVGKGTHVGVMLPNEPPFLVTWLALAKLGGVSVPINPGYSPKELRYVVETADVTHLLIEQGCLPLLHELPGLIAAERVVVQGGQVEGYLGWEALLERADPAATRPGDVGHDDVITIQFTSGSTGFPKGCLLTHLYWIVMGKVNAERGPSYERIQCELPLYYMGAYWRLSMALFLGAALHVPKRHSLTRLVEQLKQHRIEFGRMTSAVATVPERPDDADNDLKQIAIFGLKKELHAPLEKRFGTRMREQYGMTETGSCTYMPSDADDMVGSGSCGIPSPFRECMVAGPDGREVPVGEAGELWVAGAGLSTGYYKNPEATAASRVGKWFRTGDLFRRDSRGYYYIIGRIKEMIRRSGENISATEVESALLELDGVADVAVVGVPDAKRDEEVKACLVLKPGQTPETIPPAAVIAHCATSLARFKVPRYVQYFSALPKTGSEKTARHLLKAGGGDKLTGAWDQTTGTYGDATSGGA